ncbi:sel1 repeat family protein, partial [Campylobacter sp. CNRCH_2014_2849]
GDGVQRSYVQALKYHKKACELGDNEACNNVALIYANGLGVLQNYDQALKYLEKACKFGHEKACKFFSDL